MSEKVDISVIMSVYNEPFNYLVKAINSILNQSFTNFEFIIVLDNPTNKILLDILKKFEKENKKIKLIVNEKNIQLANSLNKALNISKGKYIARMDADDISELDRLKVEFNFLENNKNIDLVGCDVNKINMDGLIVGEMLTYSKPVLLKKLIKYKTISYHPTWMFRKSILKKLIGYRDLPVAQDYDFLHRLIDFNYRVSNINIKLLKYRINHNSVSHDKSLLQNKIKRYIQKLHKERAKNGIDSFSIEEIDKIKNSSLSFEKNLHIISHNLFQKAIKYKDSKRTFLFIMLTFLSMILSKYTFKNLLDEVLVKWSCYRYNKKEDKK